MRPRSPRLAARAVLIHENRLLMVNAWPDGKSALMCAPGGGIHTGSSLPDNLCREVLEETGLNIIVGAPCLINEFHDPTSGFHQVDLFFRCTLQSAATLDPNWRDPENIVTDRRWVTESELRALFFKPSSLADVAFGQSALTYDPLETIVM
ncbi:MAG: NUDIX domain-containing protein [Paracoccaceae bacterium]